MWKNMVQPEGDTDDNITRRMSIECWIPKATNTHTEHVLLIVFPRQK